MDQYRIFDHLLEGVQVISKDLRYLYLNDNAKKQGGIVDRDVIGFKCEEIFPGIEGSYVFEKVAECFQTGEGVHFLNKFTFPDGTFGYYDLRINPIPEGVLIFSLDETNKMRAQDQVSFAYDRFEKITSANDIALFEWDQMERIIFSNSIFQEMCKMFRGKTCEKLSDVLELVDEQRSVQFRDRLQKAIKRKETEFTIFLEGYDLDRKQPFSFQLNVGISYSNKGEAIGFIGFLKNVIQDRRIIRLKELKYEMLEIFLSDHDLDWCLEQVLKLIIDETPVFRVGEFWLPNFDGSRIRRRSGYSRFGKTREPLLKNLHTKLEFDRNQGLPGKCLAENQLIWWSTLNENQNFIRKELVEDSKLKTGIAIPFHSNNHLVGVLTLFSDELLDEHKELIDLLKEFSENIGHGIMSKRIAHQRDLLNDSATIILLNTTPTGRFVRVNPNARRMCFTQNSVPQDHDLFSLIDRENDPEFPHRWNDLIDGRIALLSTELKIIGATRKSHTLKINATTCADDDTVYIVGLDITKEIDLLDMLTLSNELASVGFWSIDLLTGDTLLSGSIEKILNLDGKISKDQSSGEILKQIIPDDLYNEILSELLNGEQQIERKWSLQSAAGTQQMMLVARSESIEGRVSRISGVIQNVTGIYNTGESLKSYTVPID